MVKHRDILVYLLLGMATVAIYWPVKNYDFVHYDDNVYVTENRHVQDPLTWRNITWGFTTFHGGNWHPLTWFSHMMAFQLFGLDAGRHHLVNLLFHVANTLLLFYVFKRMTGDLWQSGFVSVLFALHPLHVESVVWISERKDVLSTLFLVLTISCYVRWIERPKIITYLALILFFSMGLMSKPMLVTLPFLLLLLDYWPLNRFEFDRSRDGAATRPRSIAFGLVREKTPLFLLAAISCVVTFIAEKQGGSVTALEAIPLGSRVGNALISYVDYIGKMIWPAKMAILYPYPATLPWWKIAFACLLLLFFSSFALKSIKRFPFVAVGWFWYLGTLVPVIGLLQVGSQAMADRYTYVPLIGIGIIIAWGVPELVTRIPYRRAGIVATSALVLTLMTAATRIQTDHWKNSKSLFEHALEVTSDNYIIHTNLGVVLAEEGDIDGAVIKYIEALRVNPDFPKAHYNLGNALFKQDRTDEAVQHYIEALRLDPEFATARINLGNALEKQGLTDEAIHHYQEALQIQPDLESAHFNLANALKKQGRIDEAIRHYQKALLGKPDHAEAHNNLGTALFRKGDTPGAIDHFQEALRIDPEFSHAKKNLQKVLTVQKEGNR